MMDKKQYKDMELEVIRFRTEDIMTTSEQEQREQVVTTNDMTVK